MLQHRLGIPQNSTRDGSRFGLRQMAKWYFRRRLLLGMRKGARAYPRMNQRDLYFSELTLRREQLQWLFLDEHSRANAFRAAELSRKRAFWLDNYSNAAEATDHHLGG